MQIWYLGIVFLVVPMVGMSAIRATGDSRIPGAVMVSSALVNIVLDPLLIFGLLGFPRLELQGAAIATLIARAMTFVIAFYVLHRRLHMLSFQWPGLAELKQSWGAILHVGLPAAGTNIILPLATAVIVALIAGFGTEAVAGFGAATRIEAMSLVIFYALSSVIGPVVGQNLGAGKRERILEAVRASAGFCIVYGLAAALLLGLFAEALAGLFSQSPTVIAAAAGYLTVVPISYGAAGIVMMASATFNGLGLPGKSVVLSMARVVLLQVPLAYLAAQFFGLMGIFLAIAMANLTVGTGAYLWSRHICARQGKAAAKEPVSDILPLP